MTIQKSTKCGILYGQINTETGARHSQFPMQRVSGTTLVMPVRCDYIVRHGGEPDRLRHRRKLRHDARGFVELYPVAVIYLRITVRVNH